MEKFNTNPTAKSDRIPRLVENLYRKMPEIEADRAVLLTESYRKTEGEPMVMRRAKAFAHILANIPIIIREEELVVGSSTLAPRGCQTFPEYSWEWLEAEFDTIEKRSADPFYISEETKARLREVHTYWKGKTNSELALSYMAPETVRAMEHNVFTPGNYFYNGVGHVTVHYDRVLEKGLSGIIREAVRKLWKLGYRRFAFLRQDTADLPNHRLRLEGYRQAAAEAVGADFIELPLPDPADTPGRAAFAEAVKGRVCFSAQDGTALSAYRLLGEAAKETVLGGFDDFPLFREIGTPAFTFRYQIDTVCRWAMELARSASAEPYLPPVHLAVSAPMLCYHFDPESPPFPLETGV